LEENENKTQKKKKLSPFLSQKPTTKTVGAVKQPQKSSTPAPKANVGDGVSSSKNSLSTVQNKSQNVTKTNKAPQTKVDAPKKTEKNLVRPANATKKDKKEEKVTPKNSQSDKSIVKNVTSSAKKVDKPTKKTIKKIKTDERVSKVDAKKKKSFAESEKVFENNENESLIRDTYKINEGIDDVGVSVGKDIFADISTDMSEGKVQEKEVSEVHEKVVSVDSGEDVVDGMLYKNIDRVLHESMIPYSEHVILDRAIPRVEDGLKPVQRRILYSMMELGVTPDKPYRKSARIVGDCLGKYHPHGDSSVYDAMVRMAQPFNTNALLVSGHGNFGSVDGDGAAAMRYTEARLAPLAMELLRDLDKNTVRWGLNFDDTLREPEILPGRFPNLLVNGSTGIAVGLATNIPPHNLAETIDGVVSYINNPKITLKEMMKIIKGPDFPTGGYILSSSELAQAYATGRGKIYIRAKMHVETNNNDKKYIVITELPYQVNKASLLQKINSLRDEDKFGLGVISEVRDESDRDGMRAVIRLKKDANVNKVFDALIKNTDLQCTFGVNMVAIANGKPRQMGLLDIISYYAEYQREVILRRSKYDCEMAKEREHILSGLIIAIKNIDAVVKIIKTSANTTEAKKRLREKFVLSEKQAQAILDMRLARLTSLEVYKLEEELKQLRELIKKLTAIINSRDLQFGVVKDELLQIKREHRRDRMTRILRDDKVLEVGERELEPQAQLAQKMYLLKSAGKTFKFVSEKHYNLANKTVGENAQPTDIITHKFEVMTGSTLLCFTNLGNCFKVDTSAFSEMRYKDKGIPEHMIFKELSSKETIVFVMDFKNTESKKNMLFLTRFGMIKKTATSEYGLLKKYYQAMKLKDDDEILSITLEPESAYTVLFATSQGMTLNALSNDIPLQGRVSGGVKGISLASKDFVVCASVIEGDDGEILTVTDKGYAKRVLVKNIEKMARYRRGLKLVPLAKDIGNSVISSCYLKKDEISTIVCATDSEPILKPTDLVPLEARIGKGKPIDKSKKTLKLLSAVVAVV